MAIDLKKLRQKQDNIKGGKGDALMIFSNKLPAELDVRLLPPSESMNGLYFVEQNGWWIENKFYPTSLNDDEDVVGLEVAEAESSGDPDLIALLNRKKNNMKVINSETRYLIAVLVLDITFDEDNTLESFKVKDSATKVLVAKPSLLKAINRIVTSKPYQNGTEDGLLDRVEGFNLVIGKEGSGLDTEYNAQPYRTSSEMPEIYYLGGKKYFDLMAFATKGIKSKAHLRSVIRNYLYGEDIILDASEDDSTDGKKSTKTIKSSRPISSGRPAKQSSRPPVGSGKSLLGDLESELGDLD